MATPLCPQCHEILSDLSLGEQRCGRCGASLRPDRAGPADGAVQMPPPGESGASLDLERLGAAIRVEEETLRASKPDEPFDSLPAYPGAADSPESALPDVAIRRSDHGETLAVLALLLPLLAEGVILVCRFDSLDVQTAISVGTVAVTALLLAVD